MANIKSNEKSLRQNLKVHKNNHSQLAAMRTNFKKYNNNVNDENVSAAYKSLDTIARKGIIHKNKANRMKSRIALKNNQLNHK